MNVSVSDNSLTFRGVNAYKPPMWIDEAIKFLQNELGECFVEGNNDQKTITVTFVESFDEDKIEQILEKLRFKYDKKN